MAVGADFLHNWHLKLTAFSLAVLAWYLVHAEEILEVNRKLHVYLHTANGYLVKGDALRTKDVTLKGPRALIADVAGQSLEAHIYVPKGKTGQLRYRVDKEYIPKWNPRIQLTVHDAYLNAVIGVQEKKRVPVSPHFTGELADHLVLQRMTVVPDQVELTGLGNELAQLHSILTAPIDLSQVTQSKQITEKLILPDAVQIALNLNHVDIDLTVEEKTMDKEFRIPTQLITGVPDGYRIDDEFFDLVLTGKKLDLAKIEVEMMKLVLLLPSPPPRSWFGIELEVDIILPAATSARITKREKVRLTLAPSPHPPR